MFFNACRDIALGHLLYFPSRTVSNNKINWIHIMNAYTQLMKGKHLKYWLNPFRRLSTSFIYIIIIFMTFRRNVTCRDNQVRIEITCLIFKNQTGEFVTHYPTLMVTIRLLSYVYNCDISV